MTADRAYLNQLLCYAGLAENGNGGPADDYDPPTPLNQEEFDAMDAPDPIEPPGPDDAFDPTPF